MDYEKMYKAVLKTATQWIKDGCSDKEKICLESIFPEFLESEDERIRKEIIDFIQWAEDRGMTRHDYHQAKRPAVWIAYLEKQKECVVDNNKTSAEEDERIRARLIEYFQGFLEGYEDCYKDGGCVKWEGLDVKSILAWLEKQKEQKHPNGCFTCDEYKKGYEEGRRNGFTAGYNKAMKEVEQKEQKPVVTLGETYHVDTLGTQQVIAGKMPQKPAEWDDYTKTNLGRAIQIIKDARGTLHGYQTDDGIYECDKAIEALEHFLYRGLEIEKPAEWSEEDEKMRNRIIETLSLPPIYDTKACAKMVSWLKSLPERFNLQPKQEWSEEDEKKITFLEQLIRYNVPEGQYGWTDGHRGGFITKLEAIAILKSLRPSWKPSEAQLMALHSVIDDESDTIGNEQLKLLYNDLKKL